MWVFLKKTCILPPYSETTTPLIPLLHVWASATILTTSLVGCCLLQTNPTRQRNIYPAKSMVAWPNPTGQKKRRKENNLFWAVVCILSLSLTRMRSFFFRNGVMTQTQLSFFLNQKSSTCTYGTKKKGCQRNLFCEKRQACKHQPSLSGSCF